eukprot:2381701-Prymnesium_polylepis.1
METNAWAVYCGSWVSLDLTISSVQPLMPQTPPAVQLATVTCSRTVSFFSGTSDQISYRAESGGWEMLDNPGDDRGRGQTDVYSVSAASSMVSLRAHSNDAWCLASL